MSGATLTVNIPPPPSSATLLIQAETTTDRLAGEAVWFPEPTVSGFTPTGFNHSRGTIYDNRLHDIYYRWDFERAHSFQHTLKVLNEWKDGRFSFGPFTATCFNTAGTYDITCFALDRDGNWAEDTYQYTCVDPAVAFPTTQTIAYAPDGDFTGAPAGCQQFTSWTAAMNAYKALKSVSGLKGRLVFRPGATINFDFLNNFQIKADWPNWVVMPWGPGRTTIQVTDSSALNDGGKLFNHQSSLSALSGSALYQRLDFDFPWDSTTETGKALTAIQQSMSNLRFTVNDCTFSGCRTAVGSDGQLEMGTGRRILFDCKIENWQDFGVYDASDTNVSAYVGCNISQDVNAYMGAGNKAIAPNRRNDHGPTRNQAGNYFLFDACDLFTRNAWELTRNPPNVQPAGRIVPSNEGAKVNIGRTTMEGGNVVLLLGSLGTPPIAHAQNVIIDKTILVGCSRTGSDVISSSFTGHTVRNSLLVLPDVNYTQPTDAFISGFESDPGDVSAECGLAGRDYYNNTLLYLIADAFEAADPFWIRAAGEYKEPPAHYQNWTQENNLFIAPNSTTMGATANAALADFLGTTLFTPRWLGHRYQSYIVGGSTPVAAQPTMDTSFATPLDTIKDMTPVSNVQTVSSGKYAFDDIRGNPRYDATTKLISGTPKGAFETGV